MRVRQRLRHGRRWRLAQLRPYHRPAVPRRLVRHGYEAMRRVRGGHFLELGQLCNLRAVPRWLLRARKFDGLPCVSRR